MENKDETIAFKYEQTKTEEPTTSTDKKPKMKFKYRFRPRHLILIVAAIIVTVVSVFLAVNFFAKTGEPVYGDRCVGAVEVDQAKVTEVINQFNSESDALETAEVSINCLTFEFKLGFKPEVAVEDAKNVARDLLTRVDQSLGHPVEEGRPFSNLFYRIDGVKQYDVTFMLTGGEGFPVFGSKQALAVDFAWTSNSPKDPDYARQLREEADRLAAEEAAQKAAEEAAKNQPKEEQPKEEQQPEEKPAEEQQPAEENKEGGGN